MERYVLHLYMLVVLYIHHTAIQGSWNEKLQLINDAAIKASDLVIVLTPPNIEANGTTGEMQVAIDNNVELYHCPPDGPDGIEKLLSYIQQKQKTNENTKNTNVN